MFHDSTWWKEQLSGHVGEQRIEKALRTLKETGFTWSAWNRRFDMAMDRDLYIVSTHTLKQLGTNHTAIPCVIREALCSLCAGSGISDSGHDENCRKCHGKGYLTTKRASKRVPRLAVFGIIKKKALSASNTQSH